MGFFIGLSSIDGAYYPYTNAVVTDGVATADLSEHKVVYLYADDDCTMDFTGLTPPAEGEVLKFTVFLEIAPSETPITVYGPGEQLEGNGVGYLLDGNTNSLPVFTGGTGPTIYVLTFITYDAFQYYITIDGSKELSV